MLREQAKLLTEVCAADPGEQRSPYGSYWYRAVACLLLSGRLKANADGYPNRTDVNRACKEANFNQYLCERVARFLIAAEVTQPNREGRYGEGPNAARRDSHLIPAGEGDLHRRASLQPLARR